MKKVKVVFLFGVIAIILAGLAYGIHLSSMPKTFSKVELTDLNSQLYSDQKLGLSFRYPSGWSVYEEASSKTKYLGIISLIATSTGQINIKTQRVDEQEMEAIRKSLSTNLDASMLTSGNLTEAIFTNQLGERQLFLAKKQEAGLYLIFSATVIGPILNKAEVFGKSSTSTPVENTTLAEQMLFATLPTFSFVEANQAPQNVFNEDEKLLLGKDPNNVGIHAVSIKSEQKTFDAVSIDTPLQGHVLVPADEYIFTDGGGGIDTVGYKQPRSHYTIYTGKDVPGKGYHNVVIVSADNPHFIEVDVNSEYLQFSDQILSIPDLKEVSRPRQ